MSFYFVLAAFVDLGINVSRNIEPVKVREFLDRQRPLDPAMAETLAANAWDCLESEDKEEGTVSGTVGMEPFHDLMGGTHAAQPLPAMPTIFHPVQCPYCKTDALWRLSDINRGWRFEGSTKVYHCREAAIAD